MLKFFRLPFATTGDKTAVPDAVDSNGNVSYSQGYGFDYQRQKTDPAAKNIERDKMNQVFFDMTTAIAELQSQGVPDFITTALNGGAAYSYAQYAVVKYSGDLYISLVAANTALPSDATKWALLPTPARVRDGYNTVAASGGTADAVTLTLTPTQTAFAPGPTWWRATAANATATPTVKRDGLAAKTLVKGNNLPLAAGDIPGAGAWMVSQYDATLGKEVLLNPALGVTPPVLSNLGQLKNLIINGGCSIAQRAAASLSTTPTYGGVDRFAAWATGTAVSAGTISQDTASPIGRTGYALKLAGVTVTGSGIVFARQRIESANARRLKNQIASFSALVYHDVGSAINYTITVRKPNAADNYTGTTVIATGSATSVPNTTATQISLPNITMGDCSNGIEVEIRAACGAVTTKNFSFTELQLEEGTTFSTFERRDNGIERQLCQRYYEQTYDDGVAPATATRSGLTYLGYRPVTSGAGGTCEFKVTKRVAPTAAYWDGAGNSNKGSYYAAGAWFDNTDTITAVSTSPRNVVAQSSNGSGNGSTCVHYTANAEL